MIALPEPGQSWPLEDVELPSEALSVPTMLTRDEQRMLYVLARDRYRGEGAIVDAGCFMGGSTVALAAGLEARGDPPLPRTIVSYDRFEVEDYFLINFADQLPNARPGQSFRHLFERNVAPFADLVEVRAGDFANARWEDGPIEILFLDICKDWRLNDVALNRFMGALIPGGVLIQQDYLWGSNPWLHITMELLAPYVRRLAEVPASVAYVLERPIPPDVQRLNVRLDLSRRGRRELMAGAAARWDGDQRGVVECSATILDLEDHGPRAALQRLDEVAKRHGNDPAVRFCVDFMRPIYRELGWRPFAEDRIRRLWRVCARRAGRARPTFDGT